MNAENTEEEFSHAKAQSRKEEGIIYSPQRSREHRDKKGSEVQRFKVTKVKRGRGSEVQRGRGVGRNGQWAVDNG